MGNPLAEAWRAIGLERSPLLADLTPADRNVWRFIAGLACAIVVLVALSLLLAIIVVAILFVVMLVQGRDLTEVQPLVQDFVAGKIGQTWGISLATFTLIAATNALMMGLAVWIASALTKKPFKASLTMAPRWRWRQLLAGLLIYGVFSAAIMAFDLLVGEEHAQMPMVALSPDVLHTVLYVAIMIPAAILAAGAEELVFRGWFLRHTAALTRLAWIFLPLNGVLFSLIHLDFDPNALLARALMGVGLCWMALRLGGVEFSTGAHAANNILILLFIEPLSLTPPPPQPFSWMMTGEILVMFAFMVASVELAIRVRPLAHWLGVDDPANQPPSRAIWD